MSSIISRLCLLVFVGIILSGAPSAQAQIVGGAESAKGEWPYFAGLFYKYAKKPGSPKCGAVIWDKDTLLTAAHCVMDKPDHPEFYAVYMGSNSYKPKDILYMFKVREIIRHPGYQSIRTGNDIALIFLDRSIDFNGINRKVQCVNHPEPLDNLDTSKCVSMGWGINNSLKRSRNLMEVVLPILDNQICSKKSRNFKADHHLCAGYVRPTVKTGSCNGDSGGPLVCPQKANPHKYSLVGITSFGGSWPKCGRKPDYFINVELFEDWIDSVHSNTRNAQTPTEMYWADFKKDWFGSLSSFNSDIQPGAILHPGALMAHSVPRGKPRHKQHRTAHTEHTEHTESAPLL